jgi:hypothetical protein
MQGRVSSREQAFCNKLPAKERESGSILIESAGARASAERSS